MSAVHFVSKFSIPLDGFTEEDPVWNFRPNLIKSDNVIRRIWD